MLPDLDTFEAQRGRLLGLAYRMLGSAGDAEDIVQESYLRWLRATDVDSPRAWLSATVTRLCIDHMRSARVRREQYVGPWLPEPLLGEAEPADAPAMTRESLSMAFLLLLERLDPVERAVFLLREVFEHEYSEIAEIVGKSEDNCRQILKRARAHISVGRVQPPPDPEAHSRILTAFLGALATGDASALQQLLTDDVRFHSDGGGKVRAALRVIHGPDRVLRLLFGLGKRAPGGLSYELGLINGLPGLVMMLGEQVFSVLCFSLEGDRIRNFYLVINPDKLTRLSLTGPT